MTCIALDDGASLIQVSRPLFMHFIAAKPRALQIYLHKVRAGRALSLDIEPYSGQLTRHLVK